MFRHEVSKGSTRTCCKHIREAGWGSSVSSHDALVGRPFDQQELIVAVAGILVVRVAPFGCLDRDLQAV